MDGSTFKLPRGEFTDAILAFRRAFYAVAGFSFAINVLLLVPSVYMLQVYDRVLTSRNEVTLVMLTIIMLGLYAIEAVLEFVRTQVLTRVSTAFDLRLNKRLFDAAFERTLAVRGGNPAQALADLSSLRLFLTSKGLFAFFDTPWTPIFLVVTFLLSPWLGLFSLLAVLILLALAYANQRATGHLLEEAGKLSYAANNFAVTNLRNAEAIEAMGMLPAVRRRWFERHSRMLVTQSEATDRAANIGAITRFCRLSLQSGVLGLGAWLVIENQMTPGGMIAASILLGRSLAPIDLAIATWRSAVSARAAHARLSELLDTYTARRAGITLPRPQGTIAAENLVVAAPGSQTAILKGLNFRVQPGMLVAVVGPSASGKSTLARALMGVWAPQSGALRLDGAEIHTWNKDQLGPWLGYLPQDVELFDGTIAENIARFGELDSARIVQAAQKTGVDDMVRHLPRGYDTPIGEAGAVLSGGQRQRIALARALYGDPALIVLDEPDANLDDAGLAALIGTLRETKQEKRTVFVMTHRIPVVGAADEIIVMAGGTIHMSGSRDSVLNALRQKSRVSHNGAPSDEPPA